MKNDDLGDLKELAEGNSKVEQMRLEEKLGKQVFHYAPKELFGPFEERVREQTKKLLRDLKKQLQDLQKCSQKCLELVMF